MFVCKEEESRTALLLGAEALERLHGAHVAVFGVGGVGGYVCEALARCGVGELTIVDNDRVSLSNLNRQIIALHSTVGRYKTEVMRERILDINPDCTVHAVNAFYLPETADAVPLADFDYVVDAIDTVAAKIELAVRADALGVPLISSMGTGNKLDASALTVTDLFKTTGCPLARVLRRELKQRGLRRLKVVYSTEPPAHRASDAPAIEEEGHARVIASLPFVPASAGLLLASEVVRDLSLTTAPHV